MNRASWKKSRKPTAPTKRDTEPLSMTESSTRTNRDTKETNKDIPSPDPVPPSPSQSQTSKRLLTKTKIKIENVIRRTERDSIANEFADSEASDHISVAESPIMVRIKDIN